QRKRSAAHPWDDLSTRIEGSSTAQEVVAQVRSRINPGETVMVVLDSDHSYGHVMSELQSYAPLVTPGSWIIATDGVMRDLEDVPRGKIGWRTDNPANAANDFAKANPSFRLQEPAWPFNESTLKGNITHWPDAWLRRV
ncbi:MAG: CmcI family methyltransferase, partial [Alphaproteobacteria bacterium]